MIGRALVFGVAMLAAVPVAAQPAPALTMTCHLMFRGVPMREVTTYTLSGGDLVSTSAATGARTRISTAGVPLALGNSIDRGVVTRTAASHVRKGSVVTRRVYWQTGSRPRSVRFTETYDFKRQTITRTGDAGDSCHHDGR